MCTPWRPLPDPCAHREGRRGQEVLRRSAVWGGLPQTSWLGSYLAALPPTPNSLGGWQLVHREAGDSDPASHYVILGGLSSLCTPALRTLENVFELWDISTQRSCSK